MSETLAQPVYVGLSLPSGYELVSADPAPSRIAGQAAVWELPTPAWGQAGLIALDIITPTGLATVLTDRLWAWTTADTGAATVNPPAPPNWTSPGDAVWGGPQDVLPQLAIPQDQLFPDVWVRKDGPRYASPGDTINYIITVGNKGVGAADGVIVRDQLPAVLGGGDRLVGNLAELLPGVTWRGLVSAVLPWGVPQGEVLSDLAYVSPVLGDPDPTNDSATRLTTILAAHDPNQISVSPAGAAERGDTLTYTLECQNEGAGTAYGVYTTADLDPMLEASTLVLPPGMSYEAASRALTWEVGTLPAGQGRSTSFMVGVAGNARRARPILGHATVYFPSVPEETPTNVVANVVNSTFRDVAWDFWAILQIELTCENGIVGGYPDGAYRPGLSVTRDQMAVFISRALAGGNANVPTGPPTASFPDVLVDRWAYRYIEYAQSQGVVGGYSDGTYRPALAVDRGQMAIFVARALAGGDASVPSGPAIPTFPDVTPSTAWAWAQRYVEYTVSRGVVSGYPDGNYHPEVVCTRDQMAVFVARAFALPM